MCEEKGLRKYVIFKKEGENSYVILQLFGIPFI